MSELMRRMLAGTWFALAAAIPVAYFFLRNPFGSEGSLGFDSSMILTAAVPIFISGVCGLGLGADILNPEETKTAFQAIGRGLIIAFLSYLVLFVGLVAILAPKCDDIIGIIVAGAFFFFYGLIFLGWLIALIGAAAGGFLYLFRMKALKLN